MHIYKCTCIHVYTHVHTQIERKTKQHNTTQDLSQLFLKENAALRWDSNPHLTYAILSDLPTELLRQLSWLSSNHPYKSRQSKAKQASQQVNCIREMAWVQVLYCIVKDRALCICNMKVI